MRGGKGYTDSLPTKNWGERTRSSAAERLIIEPAAGRLYASAEGGAFAVVYVLYVFGVFEMRQLFLLYQVKEKAPPLSGGRLCLYEGLL